MSEERIILTPEEKLAVCNMTSTGTAMAEAIAAIEEQRGRDAGGNTPTEEGKRKISPRDKKAALAKEIEALGGEVPEASASVAKFGEALTAAKVAKEEPAEEPAEEVAKVKNPRKRGRKGKATDTAEDLM